MTAPTVVWFRRDLRVHDHPALSAAAADGPVAPLFVLDPTILEGRFASPNRAWFLLGCLTALDEALTALGAPLTIRVGRPVDVVPAFGAEVGAGSVTWSRDLTPFGRDRDRAVAERLATEGIATHARRGLLIHEPESILTGAGTPFRAFAPFLRRWEAPPFRDVLPAPDALRAAPVLRPDPTPIPDRTEVRDLRLPPPTADPAAILPPGEPAARDRLARWLAASPEGGPVAYADRRDRLDDEHGTSRLSADLRFGTLSPVEVATRTLQSADGRGPRRFVSELAWRDFYAHVLWHDPDAARRPTQPRYVAARYPDPDPALVEAWRTGQTGYPIVDAAMRQLLATGFLPNRARMIVASFLTKDLLVDWRVGEAHFMRHLVDGDPASNLGGWQWAASVGTDAQPYVRVFNPVTQGERFDPDGVYVRRWVPELAQVPAKAVHHPWTMSPDEQEAAGCRIGTDYPAPIVEHAEARRRAIAWHAAQAG